jgi:hypothetical protein
LKLRDGEQQKVPATGLLFFGPDASNILSGLLYLKFQNGTEYERFGTR